MPAKRRLPYARYDAAASRQARAKRQRLATGEKAEVKRLISAAKEKKYYQLTFSSGVDTTGTVVDCTPIPQGDSDSHRDGDEATIQEVDFSLLVRGADSTNLVRVVLVQWYQSTTPTLANVIQGYEGSANLDFIRPTVHDTRKTFHVMYDRTFSLNDNSTGSADGYQILVKKKLTPGRKKIQYTAGSTSGFNKIYALMFSDSGAAANPTPYGVVKTLYTDS